MPQLTVDSSLKPTIAQYVQDKIDKVSEDIKQHEVTQTKNAEIIIHNIENVKEIVSMLKDQLDILNKQVFIGNGEKPILIRLTTLEKKIDMNDALLGGLSQDIHETNEAARKALDYQDKSNKKFIVCLVLLFTFCILVGLDFATQSDFISWLRQVFK